MDLKNKPMTPTPKAIFSWSGGKDSAYCLHKVLSEKLYDVCYLLTTINATHQRVSMHGVRETLLEQQAKAIGIPLLKVYVTEGTNAEYETQMATTLLKAKQEGINNVIFGDIFLEDLRLYREEKLAILSMQAIFPLWKLNTHWLIADFIAKGFKTITCCVNDAYFDENSVGTEINPQFIATLAHTIDPCGENGEYHSFCYAGPLFKTAIPFITGDKIYRPLTISTDKVCSSTASTKGFWFCDLINVAKPI